MGTDPIPHPKNAPGPFYVERGCCTACGVPEAEAPDHFIFDDNGQCYVRRQPATEVETYRVLTAMWASEMKCVRYREREPAILARLSAMGEPDLCDFPPAEGIPVVLRNHVAFRSIDGRSANIEDAVADFRAYWMEDAVQRLPNLRQKLRGPRRRLLRREIWFEISWYENRYHRIYVSRDHHNSTRIVMFHSPTDTAVSRGLSNTLDRWLAQSKRFGEKQWYTAREWANRTGGFATPW